MRRKDRAVICQRDILKIIRNCDVCRLAFNDSKTGFPYVLPLNFGFSEDDDGGITLFFHGANEGYKYDVISRDPRATFEMDCNHELFSDEERGYCTMEYQSVIRYGRVEIVDDRACKIDALTALTDNYHTGHFDFNQDAVDRTTVMKLRVEGITAKQRIVKK